MILKSTRRADNAKSVHILVVNKYGIDSAGMVVIVVAWTVWSSRVTRNVVAYHPKFSRWPRNECRLDLIRLV